MGMNCYCENCGWSEIVKASIICCYSGLRTWRDGCCEAWKPKGKETNMVEVVRCKDCKWWHESETPKGYGDCGQANGITLKSSNWYCADGERRDAD